jgi:hypothetical protein
MRDCCPANQFSGCCEGRSCQSGTVPIINLEKKLIAKQTGDIILCRTIAVASLGVLVLSFLLVGLPEMQRWEKANQEQITWNR